MIKLFVEYFDREDDDTGIRPVAEYVLVKEFMEWPWPRLPAVGEYVFIGEDHIPVHTVYFNPDGDVELAFKLYGEHISPPLSQVQRPGESWEGITITAARRQGFVDAYPLPS